MMRFDKLTVKAQEAVQAVQEVAARHQHQPIEPLHLLAALIEQHDGIVPPVVAKLGVRPEALEKLGYANKRLSIDVAPATASLYIVAPLSG